MAEVSRLLVEKGADVNARDRQQNTPLHWAVCGYKIDFVRLLIEKGADVNAKDGWQYTPLHRAARCGKTEVARFLIERGADANAKDYDGDTPAMIADKMNHPQTASAIRRQGGGSAKQDFETRLRKVAKQGFVLPDDLMVIVKLAGSLVPPPTTPQQARDEMTKGIASSKLAKHTEDFRQAGEHFKKASVLAPWLSESYFNLSIVQEKQYKWDEAISSLEKYLIAAPDARDANAVKQKLAELDIEKEVSTGVAIYNKGSKEYNEAILHWKKAIELYPQHPQIDQVYYNIGEAYMNQSNLDDAFKYMQKSMEVNPDANNAARYTNMGVVLDRRGDGAKACIYYKKGCNYGSKIGCDNHRDMNCQ
jgi:tetratricopeptide (TPR) repeat protein